MSEETIKTLTPWVFLLAVLVYICIHDLIRNRKRNKGRVNIIMPNAEQLRSEIILEATAYKHQLIDRINQQHLWDVGSKMSEKRLVSDGFVCLIERLRREGKISDWRADWYYQRASLHLGLDTYNDPLQGEALKRAIRSRLNHRPSLYKPIPDPGRRKGLKDFALGREQPPWKED